MRGMIVVIGWLISSSALAAPFAVENADYTLEVAVPEGWQVNNKPSSEWNANALFFRKADGAAENAGCLIRLRVNRKADENIAADLSHDKDAYAKQHPKAVFKDYKASHPSYVVQSKIFMRPGELYEYLVYLNPGTTLKYFAALTLEKFRAEATPEELSIFQNFIKSVSFKLKKF